MSGAEQRARDETIAALRLAWARSVGERIAALKIWESLRGPEAIRAGHAYQAARYAEQRAYDDLMDAMRSDETGLGVAPASAREAA